MNDRFKFRVWLEYAKLYYGLDSFYYDRLKNKYTLHFEDGHTKTIKEKDCVIEQCTGLKDKNGKLIYEGDIVEVSEAYENGIYKIEFCQSDCEYNLYNKEGNFIYQLTKSMARYMKVIGNIHENKELLDEQ